MAYRRVIASTIVLALAVALLGTILEQSRATVLYTGILLIEAVGDAIGTSYLAWLAYRDRERPRGWLLLFLTVAALFITIAYLMIGGIVILRGIGIVLPAGLGLTLTGQAVILIGSVPIMKAILFWLVQHDNSIEAGIVADEPSLREALADPAVAAALRAKDMPAAAHLMMVCLQRAGEG